MATIVVGIHYGLILSALDQIGNPIIVRIRIHLIRQAVTVRILFEIKTHCHALLATIPAKCRIFRLHLPDQLAYTLAQQDRHTVFSVRKGNLIRALSGQRIASGAGRFDLGPVGAIGSNDLAFARIRGLTITGDNIR